MLIKSSSLDISLKEMTIKRAAKIKREVRITIFEGKELEDEKLRISLIQVTLGLLK